MGRSYEPKPDTGWEKGPSPLPNVRRWRTPLDGALFLGVTVAETAFIIGRVVYDADGAGTFAPPLPEDIQRVELDFGVFAWSVAGIAPATAPAKGLCLLLRAISPAGKA